MARSDGNRYVRLIEHIFFDPMFGNYQPGKTEIPFGRDAIKKAAEALDIVLPLNIGDVIYAIRYRIKMPGKIAGSQPEGMEWTIEGAGHGQYKFVLTRANRIRPNTLLAPVKIPDATPEIIRRYALNDEQALLARVRYNRLIDIFLGVTTYSLQSHMRTSVRGIGQIEIDEIYIGIDRRGVQYVVPVQAKGGTDQLSVVQTRQDLACCQEKFPDLECRAISAQFVQNARIALFELTLLDGDIRIVDEKHYILVSSDDISSDDLAKYGRT